MENENAQNSKINTGFYIQIGIIAILILVIIFGASKFYSTAGAKGTTGLATNTESVSVSEIIPTGVPAVYGSALGIRYNDVSADNPEIADATIQKLSKYEDEELNAEQMERYKKIGGAISCEYCCSAEAIIFSNGERACGCAHSYAMRGLAKYLLINHPEMTDIEILSELGKWKVLFFPDTHIKKAQVLEANGIDSHNYVNLASNLYRGIEKGQTNNGGMVGGC